MNHLQTGILSQSAELQASKVIEQILTSAIRQISLNKAIKNVPGQMARQIVSTQSESIQQLRSNSPNRPHWGGEQSYPGKMLIDTIRPFSAKVERARKIKPSYENKQKNINTLDSFKGNSAIRTTHSFKSTKSIIGKTHIKQESESKKEKIKVLALPYMNGQIEYDKIFDRLRKKKQKIEEYEKSKQTFMKEINKQSQENNKKQMKFASSMSRKDYTYTFTGQIVNVINKGNNRKRADTNKTHIISCSNKQEDLIEKPQIISVKFNKGEQRIKVKDYIFAEVAEQIKPQFFNLTNTGSTKFTML